MAPKEIEFILTLLINALPAISALITIVYLINASVRRRRRSKPIPYPQVLSKENESPDLDLPHQPYAVWIQFGYFFIILLSLCQAAVLAALLSFQIAEDDRQLDLEYVGIQGANIFAWIYPSIISLLLLTHAVHPSIALPPLQWFYGINSVLTCVNFYRALPVLTTTKPEDWPIDFTLRIIATTVIITLLLILVLNLPMELDREIVIHTGFAYTSKDHGLSPEAYASLFSWWTFRWVNPLIRLGSSKTLEDKDIPELTPYNRAKFLWSDFLAMYFGKFFGSALYRRIIYYNLRNILWQIFFAVTNTIAEFAVPYFLNLLLNYIQNPAGRPREEGYLFVILIFITQVVKTVLQSQMFFLGRKIDIRVKAILNGEIYAKALRRRDLSGQVNITTLATSNGSANGVEADGKKPSSTIDGKKSSKEDSKSSNTGKIVNLMSQDSTRIAGVFSFYHIGVTSPIGILLGGYLLFQLLGWSCIAGLLVLVITMPLNSIVRGKYTKVQRELSTARDERVNVTNELVQGIRMIKFFAWEHAFASRVLESRERELLKYIDVYKVNVVFNIVWSSSPLLVTLLSFIVFTKVQHGSLDAATAFTALLLFDRLKLPLNGLPAVIMALSNASVSIGRIEEFLAEPEVAPPTEGTQRALGVVAGAVGLRDVTAQWHAIETVTPKKKNSWYSSWFLRKDLKKDIPAVAAQTSSRTMDETQFVLRNINILFPPQELSIICGPTGSGKTSLLYTLLGELDLLSGQVYLPRTNSQRADPITGLIPDGVAYVAQTAWLQNASIRDNILFGSFYEEERYQKVLECCALKHDLSIFEDGDQTEIGEKGITLSGGQKQRVSLARAVYSRAAIVLLDDCLSAVDSQTAKHIVEKCLFGELMRGRTRILVTHHVKLCLSGAKFIVRLDGGRVVTIGNVHELRETGGLRQLLEEEIGEDEQENAVDSTSGLGSGVTNEVETEIVKYTTNADEDVQIVQADAAAAAKDVVITKKSKKLVKDESKAEGSVKLQIYGIYFAAAGGFFFWISVLAFFLITRAVSVAETVWVKEWASAYDRVSQNKTDFAISWNLTSTSLPVRTFSSLPPLDNYLPAIGTVGYLEPLQQDATYVDSVSQMRQINLAPADEVDINYYLIIYCLISTSYILVSIVQLVVVFWGSLRASRYLYKQLLVAVSRAPLRFFDTTPVGRIMNRFSKDFETIDSSLASNSMMLMAISLYVITIIVIITFITPLFLAVAVVISIIFLLIGRMYINASRELKRLDSVSKSPIFSQFGETIIGVSTIRAFGHQGFFMQEILKRVDNGNRPYYALWTTNRWLSVRSDFIGSTIALSAGIFVLMNPETIDAALAGLTLNYALSFVTQINWLVRQYTQVEMDLNSVERVNEYLIMPSEPPAIIEPRPPAAWPSEGVIEVKDLVIQYAPDLDKVIRGITFNIRSSEKIGIVGRTGSGKSTLALSLFRFVDPTNGNIKIDGIDITSIGVEDLRSRLTIIPQDPVLFSGTLRSNLDPFNEHEDTAIWESLNRVHLINGSNKGSTTDLTSLANNEAPKNHMFITSLDNPVSEGGNNFSAGQKQLLCLSRALLRNSKIIVMDEATASVDFATDHKIQSTIREEFSNSTLLCIAHRLRTVIDYDRILVLDQGQVAEFDSPQNLLFQKEDSLFRNMCEKSGELDVLMEMVSKKNQQ